LTRKSNGRKIQTRSLWRSRNNCKTSFEIVTPTNAYFGEKISSNCKLWKKWSRKNNIEVNVIGCAIFRESNGLAMSSRNERLTDQQRADGSLILKHWTRKRKIKTNSANGQHNG
jgi:pantoate--beta-alanine ligase